MDKEKLDELWSQVAHIGKVERLDYDAMVALGSVFGQLRSRIEQLKAENEKAYDRIEKTERTFQKINIRNEKHEKLIYILRDLLEEN